MKEITLPVTIHLNTHLLLPLVQPEPADTDSRPEAQHCHGCGGKECVCVQSVSCVYRKILAARCLGRIPCPLSIV